MTYEYECKSGHKIERFCIPVKEIEEGQSFICPSCGEPAFPVISLPQGIALYGSPEGYSHPSATKRYSYKTINKRGNN